MPSPRLFKAQAKTVGIFSCPPFVPLRMLKWAVAIIGGMLLTLGAEAAGPERGLFELPAEKPQQAILTVGDTLPKAAFSAQTPSSPMLLNLDGILASLTTPQINLLAAAVKTNAKGPEVTPEFRRVCVVHLLDRTGASAKRVEIMTGPDGITLARELSSPSAAQPAKPDPSPLPVRTYALDAEKYRQLSINWPRYRGPLEKDKPGLIDSAASPPIPANPASIFAELTKPLVPSPLYLDEQTFSDRFLSGSRARPLKPVRVLAQEKFHIRTPENLDPARPAGLLIWVNAASDGHPPAVFSKALDELGIVCVGIDNAGNDRPVVDRFQVAIDALFAVSERVHIDPRRVYLSGISGGGRTTTRLACCFPDYFTGAVPIVGLSAYFDVPLGNGKHSPAGFDRPGTARFALLRTRRIGAITGEQDFNHDEIVNAAKRMNDDKLQVHVFDHEKFGHQMPAAEQFTDAIKWVDQPYQDARAKETQSAQAILDAYIQKWGEVTPAAKDAKARADLVKVTQTGPWTPAAWKAAALLR